jgi:preprotein translocase SecF subunit
MFDLVVGKGIIKSLPMLSAIPSDTHVKFMSYRRPAAVLSALAILATSAFFGYRGWDNFGVDFTQGTALKLTVLNDTEVSTDQVRAALVGAGFTGPQVQRSASDLSDFGNTFLVRVGDVTEAAVPAADGETPVVQTVARHIQEVLAPLSEAAAPEGIELDDVQTVGPTVGAQLRGDALNAIFWSLVMIVIYISFRFELRFAVGAVVALVHDLLLVVGIMSLMGRQISMPTIAALLTIIGYSLNDTIVVFDRIREDLKLYRGKGHKLAELIDIAINATLSRTILTSSTTLLVLIVLFFFGGDSINDFALALILGIVVGTYSSIFVASPVVNVWQRLFGKTVEVVEGGPGEGSTRRRKKREAAPTSA